MKRDQQICFSKGNLSDAIDQRSARAQKKFYKKNEQNLIFLFLLKIKIEIWNSFFDFIMKAKNEKKFNTQFHFKTKIEYPFRPMDSFRAFIFFIVKQKRKTNFCPLLTFKLWQKFEFQTFVFCFKNCKLNHIFPKFVKVLRHSLKLMLIFV